MGANAGSKLLPWIAALVMAALLAVLLVVFSRGEPSAPGGAGGDTEAGGDAGAAASGGAFAAPSPPPPHSAPTAPPRVPGADGHGATEPAGTAEAAPARDGNEYPVDLEHLRALLPDNLYWRLGEPTQDPQVLRMRAEEEQRWNELLGKVQSNTASEEEVRRYYDHRRQLSQDYIEFARLVLDEYGDRLPERDRGMYELSIELHGTRLAEIPRQIEDALARKRAHDQRREQWRRSQ